MGPPRPRPDWLIPEPKKSKGSSSVHCTAPSARSSNPHEAVNRLDSKALKAHLDHTARKVPPGRVPAPARRSDSTALSAVDRVAIDCLRNAGIENAEAE